MPFGFSEMLWCSDSQGHPNVNMVAHNIVFSIYCMAVYY